MAEAKTTDKQKESLVTLKNVDKHLQEVFKKTQSMDSAMEDIAGHLERAASKVGDIQIECYRDSKWTTWKLKDLLTEYAEALNEARL